MIFREMRRKNQSMTQQETEDILYRGTSGVLALAGDNGYPYSVPLSYVFDGEKIYFHCARSGHKLDAIQRNEKASFCVIDQDQIVPEKYTTYFKSIVVFGRIRILEDEEKKQKAIEKLASKYAPADTPAHRNKFIKEEWSPLCMLEMTIDHMTGKKAKELTGQKN